MKMKIDLANMTKGDWLEYVEICGWTLARAHARTGDAALIGGYLGTNDAFDSALAKCGCTARCTVMRELPDFSLTPIILPDSNVWNPFTKGWNGSVFKT